jgi:hypothetical protein
MIISLGVLVNNNTTENKNKNIRYKYLFYEKFCFLLSRVYRLYKRSAILSLEGVFVTNRCSL